MNVRVQHIKRLRIILPLPIQDDLSLLVAKDYSVNERYVFA